MSGVARYKDYDNLQHFNVRRKKLDSDLGGILIRGRSGKIPVITDIHFNGYIAVGTGTNIPNIAFGYHDLTATFTGTSTGVTQTTLTDAGAPFGAAGNGAAVSIQPTIGGKPYWASVLSNTATVLTLHGFGWSPTGLVPGNNGLYVVYTVNSVSFVPIVDRIYGSRSATAGTILTAERSMTDMFIPLPAGKSLGWLSTISGDFVRFTDADVTIQGFWLPARLYSDTLHRFQPLAGAGGT